MLLLPLAAALLAAATPPALTGPPTSGGPGSYAITTTGSPPCGRYDDGASNWCLGLTAGGEIGWLHRFTCVSGYSSIDTTYGSPAAPGSATNGSASKVAAWHAPAGTADPNLLGPPQVVVTTVVVNADTDIYNAIPLGGTRLVGAGEELWVMATADHVPGELPAPMDSTLTVTEAWVVGSTLGPGTLNPNSLTSNNVQPMNMTAMGFPYCWLLRVGGLVQIERCTAICFGDGSGAPCGCANEGPPGGGCRNSLGVGATLACGGAPSVSNDTFTLTADGVLNQPGLFFQGDNSIAGGNGVTFGDGIRCCGNNVVRLQVVDPPGTTSPATAQMTVSVTASGPPGTVLPGNTKCYQFWYRDPAGGGVCGEGFNLTNAITATWLP